MNLDRSTFWTCVWDGGAQYAIKIFVAQVDFQPQIFADERGSDPCASAKTCG